MQTTRSLAQRNAAFLGQALDMLETLSASAYALRPPQFERGGVGVHMRHVLDHYDAFLDGLQAGRIEYDTRARDEATESEIDVARKRLRATIARLRILGPASSDAAEIADAWVARKLVARSRPTSSPQTSTDCRRHLEWQVQGDELGGLAVKPDPYRSSTRPICGPGSGPSGRL
jgi:hypothetical protein